jgi:stage II sporulation protein M
MIRQFFSTVKQNQSWLILASVFFVGSTLLMYNGLKQNPELMTLLEETSLPMLQELGEQVFGGHPLRGAAILFLHNLRASLQVIVLGILLGLLPLLSAIANGAILGAVGFSLAQEGITPLPYLLAGILPHGVLELPAFLLSVAFGLKLGYHVVFPLPGLKRSQSLGKIFREIGAALPMIFALLAVAALLEVFVTPAVFLYFFPQ